jgi:hypothetical protein
MERPTNRPHGHDVIAPPDANRNRGAPNPRTHLACKPHKDSVQAAFAPQMPDGGHGQCSCIAAQLLAHYTRLQTDAPEDRMTTSQALLIAGPL